ncbi:MAG: bacterioferritin [Anaerolineaceae bacterium]
MKGNAKVIETLNFLLADELAAINQYIVHSEMFANWGYEKLHQDTEKRAITEMKHAEKHIARILFLEGLPIVTELHPIHIGADVKLMFENDLAAEQGAVKAYNDGIQVCVTAKDNGTKELLDDILVDEENHLDYIETQLSQIEQLGLANYLTTK